MSFVLRLLFAFALAVTTLACAQGPKPREAPAVIEIGPSLAWHSPAELGLAGGLVAYRHGPVLGRLYLGLAERPGLAVLDAASGRLEQLLDAPPYHDALGPIEQLTRAQRVLFAAYDDGQRLQALIVPGIRPLAAVHEHIDGLQVRGLWAQAREPLYFDVFVAVPAASDRAGALAIRRIEADLRNLRRPRIVDAGLLGEGALTGVPRIGALLGGDAALGRLLAVPEQGLRRPGVVVIDAETGLVTLFDHGFDALPRPAQAALRECGDAAGFWVFAAAQAGAAELLFASRDALAPLGRARIAGVEEIAAIATDAPASGPAFDGLYLLDGAGRVHALAWQRLAEAVPGLAGC